MKIMKKILQETRNLNKAMAMYNLKLLLQTSIMKKVKNRKNLQETKNHNKITVSHNPRLLLLMQIMKKVMNKMKTLKTKKPPNPKLQLIMVQMKIMKQKTQATMNQLKILINLMPNHKELIILQLIQLIIPTKIMKIHQEIKNPPNKIIMKHKQMLLLLMLIMMKITANPIPL